MIVNRKLKGKIVEVFGSQADFSKAIGVDEATVSRVVRRRRNLSFQEMHRWASLLSCAPEDIFPGETKDISGEEGSANGS
jgi:transcriptional regulator with XRE-family HTH domain